MKGKQTLLILETVKHKPIGSYELLQKIFEADYGEAYRAMAKKSSREVAAKAMKLRYHNFLYKLKRDGLILAELGSGETRFKISEKGKTKLSILQKREDLPSPRTYKREQGTGTTIVTFDIPESSRRKRDWLRSVLKALGFIMIQHSVWAGKQRIPISLIRDLQEMKLLKHIDIFQAAHTGTLKKLDL